MRASLGALPRPRACTTLARPRYTSEREEPTGNEFDAARCSARQARATRIIRQADDAPAPSMRSQSGESHILNPLMSHTRRPLTAHAHLGRYRTRQAPCPRRTHPAIDTSHLPTPNMSGVSSSALTSVLLVRRNIVPTFRTRTLLQHHSHTPTVLSVTNAQ
ncbi:hypothetical protein BD626DRAFT_499885 [Schizophyllum amplum]|uniref:Uncharacterized protein n=1 Tax=Schizophyllum amplum TaxID=97359 RepID=A0A550CBB5_9AGAR|nr:hypothetical protein BD626DRAFT_499885 [Auriculariopsis ampla]